MHDDGAGLLCSALVCVCCVRLLSHRWKGSAVYAHVPPSDTLLTAVRVFYCVGPHVAKNWVYRVCMSVVWVWCGVRMCVRVWVRVCVSVCVGGWVCASKRPFSSWCPNDTYLVVHTTCAFVFVWPAVCHITCMTLCTYIKPDSSTRGERTTTAAP